MTIPNTDVGISDLRAEYVANTLQTIGQFSPFIGRPTGTTTGLGDFRGVSAPAGQVVFRKSTYSPTQLGPTGPAPIQAAKQAGVEYIGAGASSATWTVPPNVYSVSVVAVGGNSISSVVTGTQGTPGYVPFTTYYREGGGAGLAYKNNIPVTPGAGITVNLASGNSQTWFQSVNTVSTPGGNDDGSTAATGTAGDVLRSGGQGGEGKIVQGYSPGFYNGPTGQYVPAYYYSTGGHGGIGGAAGYTGPGGNGGGTFPNSYAQAGQPSTGSGGGGGGGLSFSSGGFVSGVNAPGGQYGGGVGLSGTGPNGAGGQVAYNLSGSPNFNPVPSNCAGTPGGTGPHYGASSSAPIGVQQTSGAIRIMWGPGRSFPNSATDV